MDGNYESDIFLGARGIWNVNECCIGRSRQIGRLGVRTKLWHQHNNCFSREQRSRNIDYNRIARKHG